MFFVFILAIVVLTVWFVYLFFVASTSAVDCLERLVSEVIYNVSSGTLSPTKLYSGVPHSSLTCFRAILCLELPNSLFAVNTDTVLSFLFS